MSRYAAAIAASLVLAAPIPATAAPRRRPRPARLIHSRRTRSMFWSGASTSRDIKPPSRA